MLPKDQEKLLNDIHSRVIEYLNDIEIKPIKTGKEIKSEIDLSVGNSSDLNQIKVLLLIQYYFFGTGSSPYVPHHGLHRITLFIASQNPFKTPHSLIASIA